MNEFSLPMRPFTALVVGWYGAPNIGDELLLDILKNVLGDLGGELIVASVDPALTRELHGVDAVHFHDIGEIARALASVDVLIMGGGGIFQDHHPFNVNALYDPVLNDIAAYARPVLMARQFEVPVVIWGHGVGPLSRNLARNVVRDVFQYASLVSVRDMASAALLADIGVERELTIAPDPGWAFRSVCVDGEISPNPVEQAEKKRLAIIVREWSSSEWKDRLAAALIAEVDDSWDIVWIAFQANIRESGAVSDIPVINEIREMLPERLRGEVAAPLSSSQGWVCIQNADALFSMRLHASILGMLALKPLVGLEYDEKLSRAHDSGGVPGRLRLKLESSALEFQLAFRSLVADEWRPDPAIIDGVEQDAQAHLRLLQDKLVLRGAGDQWAAGAFDWVGAWLQQTGWQLGEARKKSDLAHEILRFRDQQLEDARERIVELTGSNHELSFALSTEASRLMTALQEKDGFAKEISALSEHVLISAATARDAAEYLTGVEARLAEAIGKSENATQRLAVSVREIDALTHLLATKAEHVAILDSELQGLRSELSTCMEANDLLSMQHRDLVALIEKKEKELKMQAQQLDEGEVRLVDLTATVNRLRIELSEMSDECDQRDAYINDKEIYIAHLLNRITTLDGELAESRHQLSEARSIRRRLMEQFGTLRRDAIRMLSAPFKVAAAARKYGIKPALAQIPKRMATLGVPSVASPVEQAVGVHQIRSVRDERLLVVAGGLVEGDGWLTRAAALAKAADRAGFFARIWCASGDEATDPAVSNLRTDHASLLREVRAIGTRLLLADASDSAIATAVAAKERGAEVVVDLSSFDVDALDIEARVALKSVGMRFVSRTGGVIQGVETERLADAGDNEVFDSYKVYPYPAEYRRRRRNILVFAYADVGLLLADLTRMYPDDQIHVVGGAVEVASSMVGRLDWSTADRAGVLAASDVVIGVLDGAVIPAEFRNVVYSTLLLERPLLVNAPMGEVSSLNLHCIEGSDWVRAIENVERQEDYTFVADNAWLGRVESLMQADFPSSVSVVVLIHNNRKIIERCLDTMLLHCGAWVKEIVVVDNKSIDGGAELVEAKYAGNSKVRLFRNEENGCSSGRNLGVSKSSGKYIAFFDSDQWLTSPSSFGEAINVLEHNTGVGAVGWNAGWFDATRDDLGGAISDYVPARGMNAAALSQGYRDDIGFLGTSGMFMSRELFDRIEGFDTFYDPTCFEDTDICFQIKKAGYAVTFRDLSGVRHQPHQTTGASEGSERYQKLFARNSEYFKSKWGQYLEFFVDYTP